MQSDGRIVLMNQAEIHDFIPFSGGGLSWKIRRQVPYVISLLLVSWD